MFKNPDFAEVFNRHLDCVEIITAQNIVTGGKRSGTKVDEATGSTVSWKENVIGGTQHIQTVSHHSSGPGGPHLELPGAISNAPKSPKLGLASSPSRLLNRITGKEPDPDSFNTVATHMDRTTTTSTTRKIIKTQKIMRTKQIVDENGKVIKTIHLEPEEVDSEIVDIIDDAPSSITTSSVITEEDLPSVSTETNRSASLFTTSHSSKGVTTLSESSSHFSSKEMTTTQVRSYVKMGGKTTFMDEEEHASQSTFDNDGPRPRFGLGRSGLNFDNQPFSNADDPDIDAQVNQVLAQMEETFQSMVNANRDQFTKMFPALKRTRRPLLPITSNHDPGGPPKPPRFGTPTLEPFSSDLSPSPFVRGVTSPHHHQPSPVASHKTDSSHVPSSDHRSTSPAASYLSGDPFSAHGAASLLLKDPSIRKSGHSSDLFDVNRKKFDSYSPTGLLACTQAYDQMQHVDKKDISHSQHGNKEHRQQQFPPSLMTTITRTDNPNLPNFGSGFRGETKIVQWGAQYGLRSSGDGIGQTTYTTRAFVEYMGPKEGYKVQVEPMVVSRMLDAEVPSDDDDDDNVRHSRASTVSEVPDNQSAIVAYLPQTGTPKLESPQKKKDKSHKAFCAASELVATEQRYVSKLQLLDQIFKKKIEDENKASNFIKEKQINALFSNVSALYQFHNEHFLPVLEERLKEWQKTQKICDAVAKNAPFLKIYSEYANNYTKANNTFLELYQKNKKFQVIVDEIQELQECENLPLKDHLIQPVQRIMRYKLLMQEYLKNLPPDHHDRKDCEKSIELVSDAANHANEIIRKLGRYRKVLEVQEQLGNVVSLVTPSRELIKHSEVIRISGHSDEHQPRQLYLFNDLLVVCSTPSYLSLNYKKLNLKNMLPLDGMKVLEGDNLEVENTFYIRTPDKCLELYTKTAEEKIEWQSTLWEALQNYSQCIDSLSRFEDLTMCKKCRQKVSTSTADSSRLSANIQPPTSLPLAPGDNAACASCNSLRNDPSTSSIGSINGNAGDSQSIKSSTGSTISAKEPRSKKNRLFGTLGRVIKRPASTIVDHKSGRYTSDDEHDAKQPVTQKQRTKSVALVRASDTSIYNGYLSLKTKKEWSRRFFALHEDYILYSFRTDQDIGAMTSLPLPGCIVNLTHAKADASAIKSLPSDQQGLAFKIIAPNGRNYYLMAETREEMAKWVGVIDLSANAELPSESGDAMETHPEVTKAGSTDL